MFVILPCKQGRLSSTDMLTQQSSCSCRSLRRVSSTITGVSGTAVEQGLLSVGLKCDFSLRCSSIQLLGDLLYKISGLSGKMSTESEEDDNFGTEAAHQILLKSLGRERRDRVFAGLYMGR